MERANSHHQSRPAPPPSSKSGTTATSLGRKTKLRNAVFTSPHYPQHRGPILASAKQTTVLWNGGTGFSKPMPPQRYRAKRTCNGLLKDPPGSQSEGLTWRRWGGSCGAEAGNARLRASGYAMRQLVTVTRRNIGAWLTRAKAVPDTLAPSFVNFNPRDIPSALSSEPIR